MESNLFVRKKVCISLLTLHQQMMIGPFSFLSAVKETQQTRSIKKPHEIILFQRKDSSIKYGRQLFFLLIRSQGIRHFYGGRED